jgi:hypothetical protein
MELTDLVTDEVFKGLLSEVRAYVGCVTGVKQFELFVNLYAFMH